MTSIDPRALGAQIRMQVPNLTRLEARVVDAITGRSDLSEATALRDVARDAGVSDAMVVKIAKTLGFAGFRDFRAALARYNRLEVASLHEEISPDDGGADMIQARRSGARCVAVTNHPISTVARVADVTLRATAQGSPLLGGTAAARIARLAVMDALPVAVAQRDRAGAEASRARTRRAVGVRHGPVGRPPR